MFRTDNPEADADRYINWLEEQPEEMVDCNYCESKVLLKDAVITEYKGVFTGYSCGCHDHD